MSSNEINTKDVSRRYCLYTTISALEEDLDRIESAHHAGTLEHSGNWTAGMNLEHVAKLFEYSIDGFPFRFVAPVRWATTLLMKKKILAGEPIPSGIKPPPRIFVRGDIDAAIPNKKATVEQGLARLRAVLTRIEDGARFTAPIPVLGKLTHDQSMQFQLSHAALHLGFLNPAARG